MRWMDARLTKGLLSVRTSKIHCRGSEVEGTGWIEPHIGENYTDELVCLMKGLEWHEKMI